MKAAVCGYLDRVPFQRLAAAPFAVVDLDDVVGAAVTIHRRRLADDAGHADLLVGSRLGRRLQGCALHGKQKARGGSGQQHDRDGIFPIFRSQRKQQKNGARRERYHREHEGFLRPDQNRNRLCQQIRKSYQRKRPSHTFSFLLEERGALYALSRKHR